MAIIAWAVFLTAACLEVSGDALVRVGLRGRGAVFMILGFAVLGSYGLVVNLVAWDFSKTFGVYVCVFAWVSVLFGRFVFRETIPLSTWVGLGLIMAGGLIIQFGIPR